MRRPLVRSPRLRQQHAARRWDSQFPLAHSPIRRVLQASLAISFASPPQVTMKFAYVMIAALVAIVGVAPTTEAFCIGCEMCRNRCFDRQEKCFNSGGKDCTVLSSLCQSACLMGKACRC
ncbi:hypothetical protein PINS_up010287 [Pythium insidiosum]|nr:hypothetical protein PINS_up010287 [Pythium insidiosum]